MNCKFKNPYFDLNKDKKFVYICDSVLKNKSIYLQDGFVGLFISENKIGVLDSELDYEMAIFKEVSIYEALKDCIPDGMRYNKELDKLVPDIIPADEYTQGIKVEFEKVGKNEKINIRENGFIKADLDKIDFTLVDPYAYKDLAKQLTIGVKKYSRDNWKKGDILSYLAALERHINDVKIALEEDDLEKFIDDTGVNQGGALMFNSMAVHYFIRQILEKGEKING